MTEQHMTATGAEPVEPEEGELHDEGAGPDPDAEVVEAEIVEEGGEG
jgi:hypothetical protein